MKLAFTIHSITVGKDRTQLPINSVQSFDDEEFDRLVALGAVRAPTEGELAIWEQLRPKVEGDVVPEKTSTKKAAAAKKAADEPAAATEDPDEVEGL